MSNGLKIKVKESNLKSNLKILKLKILILVAWAISNLSKKWSPKEKNFHHLKNSFKNFFKDKLRILKKNFIEFDFSTEIFKKINACFSE